MCPKTENNNELVQELKVWNKWPHMFIIPLAFCFAKHKRNQERERKDVIERKEEPERGEKKRKKKYQNTLSQNPPQIQNLKDFSFYLKSMEYQLIPDVWATMKMPSRIWGQ